MAREFTMTINAHFAPITISEGKKNRKVINLISFNGGENKLDIRDWYLDASGEYKMGKGVTLSLVEAKGIIAPKIIKAATEAIAKSAM